MSSAAALKAVATDATKRPPTILDFLDNPKVQKGLAAVAGKFLTPDRMLRLCVNAVKKTPLLMQCDPQTVLGAMMASAALGLEPNTVQQQAFLIPYKKRVKRGSDWIDTYECQFQVGARGFITLAYRSPHIKFITAEAIHDGDKFEHELGSSTFLKYAKTLRERGPLLGSFSYVRFDSGAESACVLPLDELMKIRARSETYRALLRNVERAENERDRAKAQEKLAETPWVMWEDDMASKSAIKKHAKQLPIASSDALAAAAELDNKSEVGEIDLRAMTDPDVARGVVDDDGVQVPQLEHVEPERFEGGGEAFGATTRQSEAVKAGAQQADQQRPAAAPAKGKGKAAPATPAQRTYAQLADAITKAKDSEAAALELDTARELPADQYDDLVALFNRTWGNK